MSVTKKSDMYNCNTVTLIEIHAIGDKNGLISRCKTKYAIVHKNPVICIFDCWLVRKKSS